MAVEASQDISCNDISTAAGPSSQMVLVGCVSSFGAQNSPKVMLPVNVLRKQCWCSSDYSPERLPMIHLCKGLVLPRQLLDPPHPWSMHTTFRLILQPLWCVFLSHTHNLTISQSHNFTCYTGSRSLDSPCSLSKCCCGRSRMQPWQMGCSSESELLHKLQWGKLGLPRNIPKSEVFLSPPHPQHLKNPRQKRSEDCTYVGLVLMFWDEQSLQFQNDDL